MKEILSSIADQDLPTAAELPGDLALVAEVIGVRNTLALVSKLRGTYVYFRNLDELERKFRNRAIRSEIDRRLVDGELISKLVPELARRWGKCERTIWSIAGTGDEPEDERQLGLF